MMLWRSLTLVTLGYRLGATASLLLMLRRRRNQGESVPMSVATLVDLWHGSRDDCGYLSPALALAAARLLGPSTELLLIRVFYPVETSDLPHACPLAEVPEDARVALMKAWKLYQVERQWHGEKVAA